MPLWDFDWDGEKGLHNRDASAGAIAVSALLELAPVLSAKGDATKAAQYAATAKATLASLSGDSYLGDFEKTMGVLLHATGSFLSTSSHGSTDVSLVYGAYFLVEALQRQAGLAL